MKNKDLFLKKLSEALDKIEDQEAEVEYCSLMLSNYCPDNTKSDRKLSYFSVDIDYKSRTGDFDLNDRSEPFVCEMQDSGCTERGYCNGDC